MIAAALSHGLAFVLGAAACWLFVRLVEWVFAPDKPAPRELGAEGYGYGESL